MLNVSQNGEMTDLKDRFCTFTTQIKWTHNTVQIPHHILLSCVLSYYLPGG